MVVREYSVMTNLPDGSRVQIRAIRPDDKERLSSAFHLLCPDSIYFRFFQAKNDLTPKELSYLTDVDFENHVGLVATISEDKVERIIGVSRFIALDRPSPRRRAEVAFVVADAHQGHGIGSQLLHHMAAIARHLGIVEFEADVLAENRQMLDIFEHAGFPIQRSIESGVVHVSFRI